MNIQKLNDRDINELVVEYMTFSYEDETFTEFVKRTRDEDQPNYAFIINDRVELCAEDEEDAYNVFFDTLTRNNQTPQSYLCDIMKLEELRWKHIMQKLELVF